MASDLRIVLDTGVAISAALLPRSVPRQAVDAAVSRGRLLVSKATALELDDVFRRPKFDKYVRQETRLQFLAALVRDAELVEITERIKECRDPNDDKFLELAASGKASHIISGDPDLLTLHPFRGTEIVSPAAFLAVLKDGGTPQSLFHERNTSMFIRLVKNSENKEVLLNVNHIWKIEVTYAKLNPSGSSIAGDTTTLKEGVENPDAFRVYTVFYGNDSATIQAIVGEPIAKVFDDIYKKAIKYGENPNAAE